MQSGKAEVYEVGGHIVTNANFQHMNKPHKISPHEAL